MNKFIFDNVDAFTAVKNGGSKVDKRTKAGKDLIDRVNNICEIKLDEAAIFNGIAKELVMLRFKDLKIFMNIFSTKNKN